MSSTPPGGLRQVAPWVSVVGVLAYVLVGPVMHEGPSESRWLAYVVGIAAVLLAVVAAVVSARSAAADQTAHRLLADQAREVEVRAEARRVALHAIVDDQLPAFFEGTPAPPLPPVDDDEARTLLSTASGSLTRVLDERLARRDAVQVAVVALGRKVQASAHRIQEEAARMVQRHPTDADILQTSMRVDHAAAQQARQAQSLAALCGEWPGQQWNEPLALPDVVKGAAGRITAFHRVEVSGDPGIAVSARVVEPLIHLVSELLANATQSSPPTTQVLVSLRQVQRGAVVEIDDCGVGLDTKQLDQARDIASGRKVVSIVDLGEIPQTGLAVVGTYARRHGFRVDITESVYGGLRAIVMIPAELTEAMVPAGMLAGGASTPAARTASVPAVPAVPATATALTASAPEEARASLTLVEPVVAASDDAWPPEAATALETVPAAEATAKEPVALRPGRTSPDDDEFPEPSALPQRRSRRGEAEALPADPPPVAPVRRQSAEEAGQWMGAFFSTNSKRLGNAPDSSTSATDADETSEDR